MSERSEAARPAPRVQEQAGRARPAAKGIKTLWRPVLAVAGIWYAVVVAIGLPPEAHFLIYAFAVPRWSRWSRIPRGERLGRWCSAPACCSRYTSPRETLFTGRSRPSLAFFWRNFGLAGVIVLSIRALREPLPKEVVFGPLEFPRSCSSRSHFTPS
jgi:hypothetical protein